MQDSKHNDNYDDDNDCSYKSLGIKPSYVNFEINCVNITDSIMLRKCKIDFVMQFFVSVSFITNKTQQISQFQK